VLLHWRDENGELGTSEELVGPSAVAGLQTSRRVAPTRHVELARIQPSVLNQSYSARSEDLLDECQREWKSQLRAVAEVGQYKKVRTPVDMKSRIPNRPPQKSLESAAEERRLDDRVTSASADIN
jgi:hypothetical protein